MHQTSSKSIHIKLIQFLSLCLLVPMLLYCCYSYQYTRKRLGKDYQEHTVSTMEATARSISAYMEIADYTAQSLHFNAEILSLLSTNGQSLCPSRQLQITNKLFNYMQQLYGTIPDASQIRIDAYTLRRMLLLTNSFQQYEKEHIYVQSERTITTPPYETYVTPTHLLYDYHFINTGLENYTLAVSLILPVYKIPSTTELIAKLSIDIPIEVIESMCQTLYDTKEFFYIIDKAHNIIFSSNPSLTGTVSTDQDLIALISQTSEKSGTTIDSNQNHFLFCTPVTHSVVDWYLVKVTPKSYVYHDANRFFQQSLLVLTLSIATAIALNISIILQQTRPLRQLTRYTDAIQQGNLEERLSDYVVYTKQDEIGRLIQSIHKMMYSINHYIIREYQLEIANKSIELKALQAQINPHFIYNTLQCIAAESLEQNNLELYRSITALGQMMQYSMDTCHTCVTLKQEVDNCVHYTALQKMRFSNTDVELKLELDSDILTLPVPKMILQPLVENCFKHGNLLKMPGARILLHSYIKDDIFHIIVEDNGTGIRFDVLDQVQEQLKKTKENLSNQGVHTFMKIFNEESSSHLTASDNQQKSSDLDAALKYMRQNMHISNHIGLCNVYTRLLLMYSSQCSLSIYPNADCGTTIHIEITKNILDSLDIDSISVIQKEGKKSEITNR